MGPIIFSILHGWKDMKAQQIMIKEFMVVDLLLKKMVMEQKYIILKIRRKVYGFAQSNGDINIQKLGADKQDDHISGVLIIFTAKSRVVGWYKDAILYKTYQDTELQERKFKDGYMGYYAVADVKNIRLLSIDERNIFPKVPRGKGGMGQSNIWYADSGKGIDYKNNILKYIKKMKMKKTDVLTNPYLIKPMLF